jgi:hypothetical protein
MFPEVGGCVREVYIEMMYPTGRSPIKYPVSSSMTSFISAGTLYVVVILSAILS